MAKARNTRMRAIVVLIAGLLAAAVVWAGTALGGSDGGAKPSTPAQSDTGKSQSGKRVTDKDCPKDRAHDDSSIDL
jgi:hypothetical protein